MAKPVVERDPDNNFLNPDNDYINVLKRIIEERSKEKRQKQNLFTGEVKYRVVGDRTFGINGKNMDENKNIAFFDLSTHSSADPFRDEDVDKERVNSKGTVDFDTIANSNVLYIASDELYHSLYLNPRKGQEPDDNLATFLLRVRYNTTSLKVHADKGSQVKFSFKDRENLRNAIIEESEEPKQQIPEDAKEEKASSEPAPLPVSSQRTAVIDAQGPAI